MNVLGMKILLKAAAWKWESKNMILQAIVLNTLTAKQTCL